MKIKRLRLFLSLHLLMLLAAACAAPTSAPTFAETQPAETLSPMDTPEATLPPDEPPAACPAFDRAMQTSLRDIERQVAELRGLSPMITTTYEWLALADVEERVRSDFLQDYSQEDALAEQQLLFALGLVDESFDPLSFYLSFYAEQLSGYYDPDMESIMLVCSSDMGGPERFTYAHEYTHALQDQHFDLTEGLEYTSAACDENPDRCAALEALLEGDAVLLQSQWLRTYASQNDIDELTSFLAAYSTPVFDHAPAFLRAALLFPYFEGQSFVHSIYLDGGWAAVDALYASPPMSTEHILHPERYPQDEPVQLELPDLLAALGSEWDQPVDTILGEFLLRTMLTSQLTELEAETAAEGWGGDRVAALLHDATGAEATIILSQWDTIADAHEFYFGLRGYAEGRFGELTRSDSGLTQWALDDAQLMIRLTSNQVLFLLAPDTETLLTLDSALPLPLNPQP